MNEPRCSAHHSMDVKVLSKTFTKATDVDSVLSSCLALFNLPDERFAICSIHKEYRASGQAINCGLACIDE